MGDKRDRLVFCESLPWRSWRLLYLTQTIVELPHCMDV